MLFIANGGSSVDPYHDDAQIKICITTPKMKVVAA